MYGFRMDKQSSPITSDNVKNIALEEGLLAAVRLDKLRLNILHDAVDWICDLTGFSKTEVRRQLANGRGGAVGRNIATIEAARSVVKDMTPH